MGLVPLLKRVQRDLQPFLPGEDTSEKAPSMKQEVGTHQNVIMLVS